MSNSDISDVESAYYQVSKNIILKKNEDFSNSPHHLSPHNITFKNKNAANAKATPFNCALHRKKKGQEVEKAYINCKTKFIPVKKTGVNGDCNNSFLCRCLQKIPEKIQEPII